MYKSRCGSDFYRAVSKPLVTKQSPSVPVFIYQIQTEFGVYQMKCELLGYRDGDAT